MLQLLKIICVLCLTTQLYSNDILEINEDFKGANSNNFLYFTSDANNTLSKEDILNESVPLSVSTNTHLGSAKGPFWTKLSLHNNSQEIKTLSLQNPISGMNTIDVYIYKENKLIKTHFLGDMTEQSKRETLTRHSMFELQLLPNEHITIISKVKNYRIYNIGWHIKNLNNFLEEEVNRSVLWGLFGGLALLFSIFNFLAYKITRQMGYLIISVQALLTLLFQFALQGLLYQLNLGLSLEFITSMAWNIPALSSIFFILFPYYFFNIKENYPKISYYFKFVIFIYIIILLTLGYARFIDENIFFIVNVLGLMNIFNPFSLILIGLYMYKKKELGSNYYVYGQGIVLFAMIIHTLWIFGILPYAEIYKYAVATSVVLDMIFLLIAQYVRTKAEHTTLLKNKAILIEQSRFSSIGQAIGNITHQWKDPLTRIGTSFTSLEAIFYHQREAYDKTFEIEIPKIKRNITLMKESMEEFSNYYISNPQEKYFFPLQTVENTLKLLYSKTVLKNVNINITINSKLEIYGYEHIFANILMILINNSLDKFNPSQKNIIDITIEDKESSYHIYFFDNGTQIEISPIEKIFDYFVSSKEDGHGLGLAMAKMLVNERLKGTITVKNTHPGVLFEIIIPHNIP